MPGLLTTILDAHWINLLSTVTVALIFLWPSKDISRVGAALIGLMLIGAAAWSVYTLQMKWLPFAEAMTDPRVAESYRLSPEQFKVFSGSVSFLLWFLPFVTASWGTNLLSDAIARNYSYRAKWELPGMLFAMCVWLVRVTLAILRLLALPLIWGARRVGLLKAKVPEESTALGAPRRRYRSSRDLLVVLEKLPQFHRDLGSVTLTNMTDGSNVTVLSNGDDVLGIYLKVSWPHNASPVQVDAATYTRLQIRCAALLGYDVTVARRKAEAIIDEML